MTEKRFQRTTITVPPDLKKRMEAVKEDINWSAIACRAFEEKLVEIVSRKGVTNMNDVIERLRVSKSRCEDKNFKEGERAGQDWAKTAAEADELERLDGWDWNRLFKTDPMGVTFQFWGKMHPENPGANAANAFWEKLLGKYGESLREDSMFMRGFAKGALDVWHQVREQL